jgi:hypothetical protein
MTRHAFNPETDAAIEDNGARAWQRGARFYDAPDYATKSLRDAWGRGYDRAEAEFVPVRHPDTPAVNAWPTYRLA